ncbi:hypothetical protein [Pseudomonas sp. LRF_L74]|uniref:hypothetical protein n=1 Tax=Pseudomonas sp. LRF_L74 TaxID=3369422 RepID=UPI003F648C8A
MSTLRRRLRTDHALDIRLSQPDAIEQMLRACESSGQDDLVGLGERLSELTGVRLPKILNEEELIRRYTQAHYAGPLRG